MAENQRVKRRLRKSLFNESVDEAHGTIRIFESEFRASEVLFQMEPESYRIHLADYDEGPDRPDASPAAPPEAAS